MRPPVFTDAALDRIGRVRDELVERECDGCGEAFLDAPGRTGALTCDGHPEAYGA